MKVMLKTLFCYSPHNRKCSLNKNLEVSHNPILFSSCNYYVHFLFQTYEHIEMECLLKVRVVILWTLKHCFIIVCIKESTHWTRIDKWVTTWCVFHQESIMCIFYWKCMMILKWNPSKSKGCYKIWRWSWKHCFVIVCIIESGHWTRIEKWVTTLLGEKPLWRLIHKYTLLKV